MDGRGEQGGRKASPGADRGARNPQGRENKASARDEEARQAKAVTSFSLYDSSEEKIITTLIWAFY